MRKSNLQCILHGEAYAGKLSTDSPLSPYLLYNQYARKNIGNGKQP